MVKVPEKVQSWEWEAQLCSKNIASLAEMKKNKKEWWLNDCE